MSINFEELPREAQQQLQKSYQNHWWSPGFSETHPSVTFLMQVLNRQYFNIEELGRHSIQQRLYATDSALEGIIANERQLPVRLTRLAVADMMVDGTGKEIRFAIADVMTDEDRQDFSALLAGLDRQEQVSR